MSVRFMLSKLAGRAKASLRRGGGAPGTAAVPDRPPARYGWFGNYSCWADARAESGGYEAANILEKVRDAILKVKHGEAVFERDSVVFDRPQYNWPLLGCLMHIAACRGGVLNVLDFGGSLGSTYFQNRRFLEGLKSVVWNIVEQGAFVACGRKHFEDDVLRFHESLSDCLTNCRPSVILLSGVLQYMEKPYEMLSDVLRRGSPLVLVDRTGFTLDDTDRLTIQRVSPEIYEASYPCWFLSRARFLGQFDSRYELMVEFDGADRANVPSVFKGFLFRLRTHESS